MITTLAKPTLMLLSSMIGMMPPGNSVFSRVMLDSCDTKCQEQRLCEEGFSWKCAPPKFEKWRHDELFVQLKAGDTWSNEAALAGIFQSSFSRPETYIEGLERYIVIAQAAYEVSRERSQVTADNAKYCSDVANFNTERCVSARKVLRWKWAPDELMYLLTTVGFYESGFRRDVHQGFGDSSRGDCSWYFADGRPASPTAKGAQRVCKSNCLNQIRLEVSRGANGGSMVQSRTVSGYSAEEIVGTDLESTKRCFNESAAILSRSRGWCASADSGAKQEDWVEATLTAYGTGMACVFYAKNKDGSLVKDQDNNPVRSVKFKKRADTYRYWHGNRKLLKIDDQAVVDNFLIRANSKAMAISEG